MSVFSLSELTPWVSASSAVTAPATQTTPQASTLPLAAPVDACSGCEACARCAACAAMTSAITPAKAKIMQQEFEKAQYSELKALEHRLRLELQEYKTAQNAQRKQLDEKEKQSRHQFFKDNPKGADRREYVKQFLERRKGYIASQQEDVKKRQGEHELRVAEFKKQQKEKLDQFSAELKKGERPPDTLWPH